MPTDRPATSRRPGAFDDPDERTTEFTVADIASRGQGEARGRKTTPAVTAVAGRALGRVFRIDTSAMLIGRADDAPICIQDEGVSRRHATITTVAGRHVLTDLGSKNGTVVNEVLITAPVTLEEGDSIRMGPHTILRYAQRDELEDQLQARLYDLATRDPLTHAFNRRALDERMASEWAWAKRHDLPVALCSFDADHFKKINDTAGHAAGDYVLVELANVIRGLVRTEDVFARVGGEEFVVLARATARASALILGERMRSAIESKQFVFEGKRLAVTISVGVSTSADPGVLQSSDLMARADAALYRAKNDGRNRVA